jgi:hypothetical protein
VRTALPIHAEDFARVAAVLGPCELVRGEVTPMSRGGFRHGKVSGRVHHLLADHVRQHDLGHVVTNET